MTSSSLRIAATADLHIRINDDLGPLQKALESAASQADVLLIDGDLVDVGRLAEMEHLAPVLASLPIPIFAVLGNHDRRGMRRSAMIKVLRGVGVRVLERSAALVEIEGLPTLGIAGVTGSGGGFRPDAEVLGPGTRMTRAAMHKSRRESATLRKALRELAELEPDITVVLTHFSPTESTLGHEPTLKYWMLGNALLGRTIDEFRPAMVYHGHAHLGNELGTTDQGVPVRNVAVPVTGGIRLLEFFVDGNIVEHGLIPLPFDPARGGSRETVTNAAEI